MTADMEKPGWMLEKEKSKLSLQEMIQMQFHKMFAW